MINCIRKIYLIFFLILSINSNAVENKIIFKVNNEIITSLDIDNEIKYQSAFYLFIIYLKYKTLVLNVDSKVFWFANNFEIN